MSEAEILAELSTRSEIQWGILQWWISISFAVMVASYLGAEKLTKTIVCIIITMYILTSVRAALALGIHNNFLVSLYAALKDLSDSGMLSTAGASALDYRERTTTGFPAFITAVWPLLSFFFTIGFTIFCYKYVKKAND